MCNLLNTLNYFQGVKRALAPSGPAKLNSEKNHRSCSPKIRFWVSNLCPAYYNFSPKEFLFLAQISMSHHSFAWKSVVFPQAHIQIAHIN